MVHIRYRYSSSVIRYVRYVRYIISIQVTSWRERKTSKTRARGKSISSRNLDTDLWQRLPGRGHKQRSVLVKHSPYPLYEEPRTLWPCLQLSNDARKERDDCFARQPLEEDGLEEKEREGR